jgi:hypothetical protein
VGYEINVYTDQPDQMMQTYSQLHKNVQDEFNEFGVEIMTPHYEMDRASPAVVPKSKWYASPAKPAGEPGADDA